MGFLSGVLSGVLFFLPLDNVETIGILEMVLWFFVVFLGKIYIEICLN